MRKRIFSTLLALCLVLSLLPAAAFAAEGEEGTETSSESQAVAQIGETTYTDFASALTAATSGDVTIKLLADVSTATLPCNNITYDLNGKTLTYTSGNSIVVGENQTLTFMDSSVSGTDRGGTLKLNAFANSYLAAINVQKNGTVDASNIKIEGNCSVFYPQGNAAAVKVTNCDVSAGCYCVGTNAGTSSNYGVQITLTGSTFVATNDDKDNCPVMINVPGTLTIDNCEITGDRQAVLVRAGTATITDSEITVTGAYTDNNNYESSKQWDSGNEVPMAAIVVGSQTSSYKADAVCTITDTKINAPVADDSTEGTSTKPAVYVSSNSKGTDQQYKSQLIISGEKTEITGDVVVADGTEDISSSVIIQDKATVNGDITNNSASSSVAVIDGATLTGEATVTEDNDSNTTATIYVEGEKDEGDEGNSVVALNTTTAKTYTDLQTAITAATAGDTIRLVKDFTLDAPENGLSSGQGAINITKNLTIDGNGKEITAGANFSKNASGSRGEYHIINIMDGANVTIQNLTLNGQSSTENSIPRSGINIFTADSATDNASEKTQVLLKAVTVKNCSTYGVTCGGSILTITDITTENNAWGGINVDNTSSSASGGTFTMNSGTINESNAIFIENTKSAESGPEATIVDGKFNGNVSIAKDTGNTQEDISGVKLIVKGGTFSNSVLDYADETIKFEVSNAGKYTYYTTGEAAVKAAGDTGVITGISDEESPLTITAPARSGAKLTVSPATTTVVAPSGYYLTSVKNEDGTVTYTVNRKSSGGGTTTYSVSTPTPANGTVTVSPSSAQKNATVTITVKPDTGYQLANLTVTDANGNAIALTQKSDTQYTFTMPASKVNVAATFEKIPTVHDCPAEKFTDVDQSAWYHEDVDYVILKGMMNGTAPTLFAPNATTTRAMIVTILYRLEGEPAVSGSSVFTDVSDGTWYTDAIAWAAEKGVVNGTSATTFAPNDPITREQMAAILYRYAQYKGYDVTQKANLSGYTDAGQISAYATDAMAWANAEGLINGVTTTTLDPTGSATRAQVAAILHRFCEGVVS